MCISNYFYWQQYYEKIHGPKTVVLYQVGNFYEVYEYDPINCNSNDDKIDKDGIIWNEKIGHAEHIGNILNTLNTGPINNRGRRHDNCRKRRHNNYSIINCSFVGFPIVHLNNMLNQLLDHGYTCITMKQTSDPANPAYPAYIIRCEDKIYNIK